jgi:hypothetical protein
MASCLKTAQFFDAAWIVTVDTPLKAIVVKRSLGPPVEQSPGTADASKFLTSCCFVGGNNARGDNEVRRRSDNRYSGISESIYAQATNLQQRPAVSGSPFRMCLSMNLYVSFVGFFSDNLNLNPALTSHI